MFRLDALEEFRVFHNLPLWLGFQGRVPLIARKRQSALELFAICGIFWGIKGSILLL